MAWIVPADLVGPCGGETVFAELADLDRTDDTDTAALAAIARSEGLIKGKLGQKILPSALAASDLVKSIDIDLSRYFLAYNRGLESIEFFRVAYTDAMRILNDLAAGRMQLDVDTKPTGSEVVTGYTGMTDVADHDDGGPLWDEEWRDETSDIGGFWDDE